ncbi:MAG: tRNA dihydrouridine synthase DusB [Phycisphaerae bacterium]|nr:tRNA dihydrouridine synthase DusB [Phycisphaerae bacterium]
MLALGPVRLATNLLLAPIAGYCDLAFRTICREQGGVGLACTDLLSPQGLLRGSATSLDLAKTNDFDKPIGMQLYGADPAIMADGARWARDHGATVVDINMGCPVDKVTKKDGGSKLLCDPDRAVRLAAAVVEALAPSGIPVTTKMRLGWSEGQPVAETLAPRLAEVGVVAVTIHGRTTEQRFSGVVSHEGIRRVVQAVAGRIPVIGNGDIREPDDVPAMLRATGCQGVMIGRGALSAPWLFSRAWSLLTTGVAPPPPGETEQIEIMRRYLRMMVHNQSERYALHQIRSRISWMAKRFPPCKPFKEAVRLAPDVASVESAFDQFLAGGLRGGTEPGVPNAVIAQSLLS